jgi:hypothetical protein
MNVSGDDLAGVVDLFGGLTRSALQRALVELAFKRGEDVSESAFADDVDAALSSYHLVAVDPDELADDATTDADATVLVAGPVAFPSLPEGAEDLPHIMDVPDRDVDREIVGRAARRRLLADAERAAERDDAARAAELLDVSYDLETWAPVDVGDVRARLDGVAD